MSEWPSKLKRKGQLCLTFLILFYGLMLVAATKSICRQWERAQGELEFRFVSVFSPAESQGITETLLLFGHTHIQYIICMHAA